MCVRMMVNQERKRKRELFKRIIYKEIYYVRGTNVHPRVISSTTTTTTTENEKTNKRDIHQSSEILFSQKKEKKEEKTFSFPTSRSLVAIRRTISYF